MNEASPFTENWATTENILRIPCRWQDQSQQRYGWPMMGDNLRQRDGPRWHQLYPRRLPPGAICAVPSCPKNFLHHEPRLHRQWDLFSVPVCCSPHSWQSLHRQYPKVEGLSHRQIALHLNGDLPLRYGRDTALLPRNGSLRPTRESSFNRCAQP